MEVYHELLRRVLEEGEVREDRTGVGTRSLFGERMVFDLEDGFPLLTTKKVHWKSVVAELLWFLRGETNVDYLHRHGVTIWDEWADENGELGPVYGAQWRNWNGIDQFQQLMDGLHRDPHSRRHILSAWNVSDLGKMALPPCHILSQFHVDNRGRLSCQLYQRSADMFLGVPFNIASYALLTHLIARDLGCGVGRLVHVLGDCHVYRNHEEQVRTLLSRQAYPLPRLRLSPACSDIFDITPADIEIVGYRHHPAIPAPVAV